VREDFHLRAPRQTCLARRPGMSRARPLARRLHARVSQHLVCEARSQARCSLQLYPAAKIDCLPSVQSPGELATSQSRLRCHLNGTHRRPAIRPSSPLYYPVKVSRHLQLRLEQLPKPIPDISWKAHLRVCQRDRQLLARGKMRLRSSWPSSPQRQSRRKTAGGRYVPAASIQQGRQDTAPAANGDSPGPAANPADDPLRGGVCLLTTGAV
jgi:hypothetical protein